MKTEFLQAHTDLLAKFYDQDIIDIRIFDQIWHDLQSMRCPHLCPWCGMPCCGITECNELYTEGETPCDQEALNKHSCQFHRDDTITGISQKTFTGNNSKKLPNYGDCPSLIRQGAKRLDWDPDRRRTINVPYTYFEKTWRIRSAEDDRDSNHGLFWKWFHAYVSCLYKISDDPI